MAKNRGKKTAVTEVPLQEVEVQVTPTNTNTNNNGGIKMALSPEAIAALLGSTRQKGIYIKYLNDFVTSGEQGVCVNEEWADLAGKKDTTLKQGFENAKGNKEAVAGSENVKVISNEGKVYLINLGAEGIGEEVDAA